MEDLKTVIYAANIASLMSSFAEYEAICPDIKHEIRREDTTNEIILEFQKACLKMYNSDKDYTMGNILDMPTIGMQEKIKDILNKDRARELQQAATQAGQHEYATWLGSLQSKHAGMWLNVGNTKGNFLASLFSNWMTEQ